MDFTDYLKVNAQKVETELNKILAQFLADTKQVSPKLVPLAQEFIKSCKGGKRIRAVLVRLGYELKGGKGTEIFKIGAAVEIMHAAILIHDDIIDQSPKRRGQVSLYKRVGEDQALTLGDLGFFLAIKIISESNFPEQEKNTAVQLFSKTMINTALGQIMDITKDDPITTAKLKTAQYTISGPLILGSILAGAEEKLLRLLGVFGENLGIAFQIKDDILDGEGTSLSQEKALKYASAGKKLIPKITKDQTMDRLLTELTQYLVDRKI